MYESTTRLELDPSRLVLGKGDFAAALNKVIPASRRGVSGTPARPLNSIAAPLLRVPLEILMRKIKNVTTFGAASLSLESDDLLITGHSSSSSSTSSSNKTEIEIDRRAARIQQERLALDSISPDSEAWIAALTDMQDSSASNIIHGFDAALSCSGEKSHMVKEENNSSLWDSASVTSHPRMMIAGRTEMGQNELAAAAIQQLEGMPCFAIDHPSLLADLNAQ